MSAYTVVATPEGTAFEADVTIAAEVATITFGAIDGSKFEFAASAVVWSGGGAHYHLTAPDGTVIFDATTSGLPSGGPYDLTQTGPYTMTVTPDAAGTGHVDFTFTVLAGPDNYLPGGVWIAEPTSGGVELDDLTAPTNGDGVYVIFHAAAGQELTIDVLARVWSSFNRADYGVLNFGGIGWLLHSGTTTGTVSVGPATLPSTGWYEILVWPDGTGSCNLELTLTGAAIITGEFDLDQAQSPTLSGTPAANRALAQGQALVLSTEQPQFRAVATQPQAVARVGLQQLDPAGIGSREAFGTPTIVEPKRLNATGIESAEAFDIPDVRSLGQPVRPTAIASLEAFGAVELGTPATRYIHPYPIVAVTRFGTAELTLAPAAFAPVAIATIEAFGVPMLLARDVTRPPPRNYLIDRKTFEVYPWPVNHETEDSVKTLGRRLTRSGISASGRLIATRKVFLIRHPAVPGPVHLLLHGHMIDRSQDQYRTFVRFFNECDDRTFDYVDASGDSYHVAIVQFDARRKMSPSRRDGSYFMYTLEVEVIEVNHGAYKRYAV